MNESETFQQKTERNFRVKVRYDELMSQGKHGHYETMFRVIREEIELDRARRETAPNHKLKQTNSIGQNS